MASGDCQVIENDSFWQFKRFFSKKRNSIIFKRFCKSLFQFLHYFETCKIWKVEISIFFGIFFIKCKYLRKKLLSHTKVKNWNSCMNFHPFEKPQKPSFLQSSSRAGTIYVRAWDATFLTAGGCKKIEGEKNCTMVESNTEARKKSKKTNINKTKMALK